MDAIDVAMLEAWDRVVPRVRADRVEALRRSLRRSRAVLARPVRAWCLCLRAGDLRLRRFAYVPKGYEEHREPHSLIIDSESIRDLCKPVRIDWPGVDWDEAAHRLGRTTDLLAGWMKRGVFEVRRVHPAFSGKHGKRVPLVWANGPLDPNADLGRGPDAAWGSLWQYLWKRVPDDLVFELTRAPVHGKRGQFLGWQWVCPGGAETQRRRDGETK